MSSPEEEITEEYWTVHNVNKVARTRPGILAGSFTGTFSEAAQIHWVLGSATTGS